MKRYVTYLISEKDPSMVLNYNRSGFEYIVQDFATFYKMRTAGMFVFLFPESSFVSQSNTEEEDRFRHAWRKTLLQATWKVKEKLIKKLKSEKAETENEEKKRSR